MLTFNIHNDAREPTPRTVAVGPNGATAKVRAGATRRGLAGRGSAGGTKGTRAPYSSSLSISVQMPQDAGHTRSMNGLSSSDSHIFAKAHPLQPGS